MIEYGTLSLNQKSNWRNTQIYCSGLISVELQNFDVMNRQGLLDLLKRSPEIGTI